MGGVKMSDHPKCGAKTQKIYKRTGLAFIPCGWWIYICYCRSHLHQMINPKIMKS